MPGRSDLAEFYEVVHPSPAVVTVKGGSIVRTSISFCFLPSQSTATFLYLNHELLVIFPIDVLEAAIRHEKASFMGRSAEPTNSGHPETMLLRLREESANVLSIQVEVEVVKEFLVQIGRIQP